MSAFQAGALPELCGTLVRRNEVVYQEATSAYATAGGTAARPGAVVPTVDAERRF
jgi:hypothetical protein